MKSQAILFSTLLIAAGSTLAGESLLENAAKQTAVESVKSAAPAGVQQIEATGQTLENAKSLTTAPATAKEQAEQAVNRKIDRAIPAEAKETAATIKAGKESVGQVKNAPNAIKEGAKQKAAEKALDLLR